MELNRFIKISPGFKAAVNLQKELDNLSKVAGFIPTEAAREVLLDFAKKIHPTASNLRSRIIMGTYGTGKSHLALVVANLFRYPLNTPEIQTVLEKIEPETSKLLDINKKNLKKMLIVTLYGDQGRIADALLMGLRRSLEAEGLAALLPESAFEAAVRRIEELKEKYSDNYEILNFQTGKHGQTLPELVARLKSYDRNAFDLFCQIHPLFSGGSQFVYSTMLDPGTFYASVAKDLIANHDYGGIAIFWDEFGYKMEEVVKDPTGREGIDLQEFAESCNYSEDAQIHFYLFCHRSLKEYQDLSKNSLTFQDGRQQREEDLRKIEGRFKPFILKTSNIETFQLISSVIIIDQQSEDWKKLTKTYQHYFDQLSRRTLQLKYFVGFSLEELKATLVMGAYPLHPMTVFSLPEISEKVAQNNRTLFTCLCENDAGSLFRFLQQSDCQLDQPSPPVFTVDRLWDYFANDVKQQQQTYSLYRDHEQLVSRLAGEEILAQRILKAVSVFRVVNTTRFKVTDEILEYSLNIGSNEKQQFYQILAMVSDHRNENRVLMRLSDGSYRTAVSNATESIIEKIKRLITGANSPLKQPVAYLNSIWNELSAPGSIEVTDYWDEFGVKREFKVSPVSLYQLKESIHILTKNIGTGDYQDGLLWVAFCADSHQIEEAKTIAEEVLAKQRQVVLAIPLQPIRFFELIMQYQALSYLKREEASLYGEGAELHEEWLVWQGDIFGQINSAMEQLFSPENQLLEYYWKGVLTPNIRDRRTLKSLLNKVMLEVFPYSPRIGDDKLSQDDFSGNWGYRKNCKDIALKLTKHDAAEALIKETAADQKHVIRQVLETNGILYKNQAGEAVIAKPVEDKHPGAVKVFECIDDFIKRAKKSPANMYDLVKKLRKPPFGLKCRVMPLFFAAAAHHDLALGNLSFEFSRTAKHLERISSFDNDTIEKAFSSPEKYRLVYINVSSNQKEVIEGMAQVFAVNLDNALLPLERVKKVGEAIGAWWRSLPGHSQKTQQLSEDAQVLKENVFKPLAEIEPDVEKVLLQNVFKEVFTVESELVKRNTVKSVIQPIREEFEQALEALKKRINDVFCSVFAEAGTSTTEGVAELSRWFKTLSEDKRNFIFEGDAGILIRQCRESNVLNDPELIEIADKMTGLKIESWSDDFVLIFQGKLDSAKKFVETYKPPPPMANPIKKPDPISEPNKIRLSLASKDNTAERIFEISGELNQNAQSMENMLNASVDSIGRSLNDQEKMFVFYRFIRKHIFGESIP